MGKWCAMAVWTVLTAVLFCGCVSIEYVGQTFEPLPTGTFVRVFDTPKAVPEGEFKPIGRVELTAPDGMDWPVLREKLQKKAAEVGADAIELVGATKYQVGASRELSVPAAMTYDLSRANQSFAPDGSRIGTDSFGRPVSVSPGVRDAYEIVIQARFLIKIERFDKIMKQRRKDVR